jgi:hypothetical protein
VLCTGAIHKDRPAAVQPFLARVRLQASEDFTDGDWFTNCPANGDALDNDRVGDCDPCAVYQWIACILAQISGNSLWRPTSAMALERYAKITGFNPVTGQPDAGTDTAADLADFCRNGITPDGLQREIVPFWTSVDHTNLAEMRAALRKTPLLVSLNLPVGWGDIEADPTAWQRPLGPLTGVGHRVLFGKRDPATGLWTARTWGMDVLVDDSWRGAMLAVDALVTRDMDEIDFESLESDMAALAA